MRIRKSTQEWMQEHDRTWRRRWRFQSLDRRLRDLDRLIASSESVSPGLTQTYGRLKHDIAALKLVTR